MPRIQPFATTTVGHSRSRTSLRQQETGRKQHVAAGRTAEVHDGHGRGMFLRLTLTRFAFCLSSLFGSSGCAHFVPSWGEIPPPGHSVGISGCVPNFAAETFAFTDALKRKCGIRSGRIELRNFSPPALRTEYETCGGGVIAHSLFRTQDLPCSLVQPNP